MAKNAARGRTRREQMQWDRRQSCYMMIGGGVGVVAAMLTTWGLDISFDRPIVRWPAMFGILLTGALLGAGLGSYLTGGGWRTGGPSCQSVNPAPEEQECLPIVARDGDEEGDH